MSNDAEWVEDVHRWYYGDTAPASYREDDEGADVLSAARALGYEAAYPALQARHWPDAPLAVAESMS
jgi:hypothetical protein